MKYLLILGLFLSGCAFPIYQCKVTDISYDHCSEIKNNGGYCVAKDIVVCKPSK